MGITVQREGSPARSQGEVSHSGTLGSSLNRWFCLVHLSQVPGDPWGQGSKETLWKGLVELPTVRCPSPPSA